MTLTKADLVEMLLEKHNFSRPEAKMFVEQFFDVLKETIVSGEQVKLSGFGNWETRSKVARPGRNPRTGEPHLITARRVCVFGAGQKLRARCEVQSKKDNNDQ